MYLPSLSDAITAIVGLAWAGGLVSVLFRRLVLSDPRCRRLARNGQLRPGEQPTWCDRARRIQRALEVVVAARRPVTVTDILDGHVLPDLESFDRIYLNGWVRDLRVLEPVVF